MKRIFSVIFAMVMGLALMISGGIFFGSNNLNQFILSENPKEDVPDVSATTSGNWSSYYASSFAGGSGTSSSPYLISSGAQLARLAYLLDSSSYASYNTKSYKLTNDIDLSAHYWSPIGLKNYFSGGFSCNGYVIYGLTMNTAYESPAIENHIQYGPYMAAGLFAFCKSVTLKDLTLANANIQFSGDGSLYYSGFVCAFSESVDYENVHVVDSYMKASKGTVGSGGYDYIFMGGITAYQGGSPTFIRKCSLLGCQILSDNCSFVQGSCGGLVGELNDGSIMDSFFNGHIDVYVAKDGGGLVGYVYKASSYRLIGSCYYVDTGTGWLGSQYAGGIVGRISSSSSIVVKSCFVDATINYNSSVSSHVTGTKYKGSLVGVQAGGTINYCCWNSAKAPNSNAGSKTGGGTSGCKAYSDATLPKTQSYSRFFSNTSFLYHKTYGRSWDTCWTFDTGNIGGGYPILVGSAVKTYVYGESGKGSATFAYTNAYVTSNLTTPCEYITSVSSSNFKYVMKGQTIKCYNSASTGYSFSNYTHKGKTYTATNQTFMVLNSEIEDSQYLVKANFSPKSYTVKFAANGGSGTMSDRSTYYDSWISVQNSFSRTGYTFSGWSISGCTSGVSHYVGSSSSSYTTTTSESFTDLGIGSNNRWYKNLRSTSGTVTFTAQWTIKSFKITVIKGDNGIADITNPATAWNYNGGNVVGGGKQITVNFGTSQTVSVSVKPGYTFAYWTGDSASTSASITCSVSQEKNYTFTAHSVPNTYILSFDAVNLWEDYTCSSASAGATFSKSVDEHGQVFQTCYITSYSAGGGVFFAKQRLTVGERYIWTIHAKSTRAHIIGSVGLEQGGMKTISVTTEWQSFSHEFVATNATYNAFVMYGGGGYEVGETLTIANLTVQRKADVSFDNAVYSLRKTYGQTYKHLPTPTRQNYEFKGWWTAASGGTQVTKDSIYSTVGNQTLYAHWAPMTISNTVHLRVINKDGSYTDVDNASGGMVIVNYYNSSGTKTTKSQTEKLYTYTVHKGQKFELVANNNSGYRFVGFLRGTTPSEAIKNPTTRPTSTLSHYPTISTPYYIYFKQISDNRLKYDETDKYFYFEDGYYPQSEANASEGLIVYDKTSGYFTINGSPSDNNVYKSIRHTINPGEFYRFSAKLISGSITNPNEAYFNMDIGEDKFSKGYGGSCKATLTSDTFSVQIPSSVAQNTTTNLGFRIWSTGKATFNNCVFEIRIERDINSELNVNKGTATGETITYSIGSENVDAPVYSYNGKKYIKVSGSGKTTSEWLTSSSQYYYVSKNYAYIDLITVNFWAYRENWNTTEQQAMVSWTNNGGWNFYLNPEDAKGYLALEIIKYGENNYRSLKFAELSSVKSGWHMFTFTFDGRYARVYFDGSLSTTSDFGSNSKIKPEQFGRDIVIGAECGAASDRPDGNNFVGKIKNFNIQHASLTAENISDLYETGEFDMWFKFEPIRWRVSDYGVENSKSNFDKYSTLRKFKNYTAFSNDFIAVSDLILGVGSMHSTRAVSEGDKVEEMDGFINVKNITNNLSSDTLKAFYNKTGNSINVDEYSGYGSGQTNAVNKNNTISYSAPFRITSLAELSEVGLVNRGARASDMVAFILGQDKNQVSYWTRDLSNLGSGVAITSTGTQVRPWLDEVLGMRFTYTFKEGSGVF